MNLTSGGAMRGVERRIDINACTRPVVVDHRIPLPNYYRIASNLLKQATIYREEKNLIDLYIILLRFSSLLCETLPSHRDYQNSNPKDKTFFKKELLDVMDELETLKPIVLHQLEEMNRGPAFQLVGEMISSKSSPADTKQSSSRTQIGRAANRSTFRSLQEQSGGQNNYVSSNQLDNRFQKSLNLLAPKEETLSRHSILGPNGLRGKRTAPAAGIRVQYPTNLDTSQVKVSGLSENGLRGPTTEEVDSRKKRTDFESVLSLDDGRWSFPAQESCSLATETVQDGSLQLNIRQPTPPPVLAQVHPAAIPPSKVADPRPGPAQPMQGGMADPKGYQDLHIPVKLLDCFLRLAEMNTAKNLETCGVLAGSLKNRIFFITTLLIPKQESTSDSCQTTDEEEIFDVQDKRALFPLGWIHTHPTQTCFMSSIDLHTHYSYQVMLQEAIAIVMAPQDSSRKHGIFHLSDPAGVSVIRNCQERGFHPHEETPDGSPIYEHCSHVYMNPGLKFDVVDLRN